MDEAALLWEKYKHDVDIHKGYLELALKLNLFYYAITGAIISFYFVNFKEEPLIKYSLLFPILMSLGFVVFQGVGCLLAKNSHQELENLAGTLGLQVYSAIALVLQLFLGILSIMMTITGVGLAVLFVSC